LSGKDPTHVDRFGSYVARYLARNVIAASLARRCEVHLSYAIGESLPLAVSVETFGTGAAPDEVLERAATAVIDLQPSAVLERFGLRHLPVRHGGIFYRRLAAYGHFGRRDLDLPWEQEDLAAALAAAAGRES
jgi:S-adenosylmethionine synthetase